MNVTYNGTALHDLGVLTILGQRVAREPGDAPKRERHDLRLRLDFYNDNYLANASAVASVRNLLKTQRGRLVVDGGLVLVDRIAHVSEDEEPEDGRGPLAGTTCQAITFNFWWEEHDILHNGLGVTLGGIALGRVEQFHESFKTTLVDELRPHRRRVGGGMSCTGFYETQPGAAVAVRRAGLQLEVARMRTQLVRDKSVVLVHGSGAGALTRTVRILDFEARVNDADERIDWSFTANYTAFPEEEDYALTDYRVATRDNRELATVEMVLSGKIAAPSLTAAQARLVRLKTQLAGGYLLLEEDLDSSNFSGESGGVDADGDTFIELTFTCTFRKLAGDILNYTYRIAVNDDVKTGLVRTSYSGTVRARGSTVDLAYAAAALKAAELGAGKPGFFLSSTVTRNLPQDFAPAAQQNPGVPPFIVTVEFNYEYQAQGTHLYLEFTAELSGDEFGNRTENVSGYATAPTLAAARDFYLTRVRTLDSFAGALLMSERFTTGGGERQASASTPEEPLFDSVIQPRFNFTLQLLRVKTEVRAQYGREPEYDWENLVKRTTLAGTVWGPTVAVCNALVDALGEPILAAGGVRRQSRRGEQYLQGVNPAAESVNQFVSLGFSDTFEETLASNATILECRVTESLVYSGRRLVERTLPDGPSLIQEVGVTLARRTVSGNVKAPTLSACENWARQMRRLLLTGSPNLPAGVKYELGPRLDRGYEFLPLTHGLPVNDGTAPANVRVFTLSFTFEEMMPEHEFVTTEGP